ncbi:hypothetical protein ACAW74_00155 [Fibrella sp. WM1]|uniref:hypothetical protein n=1 Tax=Fibrella musci TaxID=3242485 RepID=UPI003522CA00
MKSIRVTTKTVFSALFFSLFFECGIGKLKKATEDATAALVNTLQNSTDQLNSQSSDWQQIAEDTRRDVIKAVGDLQDETLLTIRRDVLNTVDRLPLAAGAEFRCNADFLRNRLKQDLLRIKAKLLKQNLPELEPVLCGVSPTGVVLEEKPQLIELFGYDLDKQKNINVFLREGAEKIDVTSKLSQPTHYHWVLNVGSGNGVPFTKNSDEVLVYFGDREMASIPVVQPNIEICESEIRDNIASEFPAIDFTPKLINGDREFNSHGPKSYAYVQISHTSSRIWATVFMDAIEWHNDKPSGDKTQVQEMKNFHLWTAPAGRIIEKITSATFQDITYIDSNHQTDQLSSGGELVEFFRFVGDTPGDEAGIKTSVHITFKKLSVILKEQGDCVSTNQVAHLPLQARTQVLKNMANNPRLKRRITDMVERKQME